MRRVPEEAEEEMNKPKITDFIPQVRNPNKHNTFGLRLLEKSIQKDGWMGAQTAAADGEIIAGSARQELAIEKFADENGVDVEPIIVDSDGTRPVIIRRVDIKTANDPRARRLSVAENAVASANYNPDGELLKEWAGEDDAIKALFSDSEWETVSGQLPTLDELKDRYGETGERDFWPYVRVQVSPETFTKYNALMKDMTGADDAEKFDALISRGG